MEFEKHDALLFLPRGKDHSLQLNTVSWAGNPVRLDLRVWRDIDTPGKGVVIRPEEVRPLYEALKELIEK